MRCLRFQFFDCIRCAGSRCLDGNCQIGTTGKGCANCDQGYFTAGTTCQECPESLVLMIPAAIVALIGVGGLLFAIWKVSGVQFATGRVDDAERRGKEDAEDAAEAASAVVAVARISNTALISSISLPTIFQLSLTFEMPFA